LLLFLQALRSNEIHLHAATDLSNSQEQSSNDKDRKSKVIVPLPYQSIPNSSKILIDSKNHLTNDRRLKGIILHKAATAYFCLVDRCEKEKNYGSCLRYLRLALNCYSKNLFVRFRLYFYFRLVGAELKLQAIDQNNSNIECKKLLSHIMSIAGDCRLLISHVTSKEEIEKFREQYEIMNEIDLEFQNVINEVGIDGNSSGKLSSRNFFFKI
jgi:hypothetical protein